MYVHLYNYDYNSIELMQFIFNCFYLFMTIIEFSIKNDFVYPSIVQHVDAHNTLYDNLV